ncbi:MAG: hypothetical protein KC940_24530 [Candidatus Omnitrophica bacterium]|nr:hypothetical protein [Candidatus Omnitrophota bacterium]
MAAGDFYFAINATFRFFLENYGEEALHRYWTAMGKEYFEPLSRRFQAGGLPEVEKYWTEFFETEPSGEVEVTRSNDRVEIEVKKCPALFWLRDHDREEVACYCRHCEFVSKEIASNAGLSFELEGGGGACHQTFIGEEGAS